MTETTISTDPAAPSSDLIERVAAAIAGQNYKTLSLWIPLARAALSAVTAAGYEIRPCTSKTEAE